MPIATKQAKAAKRAMQEKAIFKLYSFGVVTNRDDWVYGESPKEVEQKVRFLIDAYNQDVVRLGKVANKQNVGTAIDATIKWTRAVKNDLLRGTKYAFKQERIIRAVYRPFVKRYLYFSPQLNEMPNLMPRFFGETGDVPNKAIVFTDPTSQKPFMVLATTACPDMHLVGAAAGALTLGMETLDGTRRSTNVTDWTIEQFRSHYELGQKKKTVRSPRKRYFIMFTPFSTIQYIARSMR
jgi:predicted helicase